MIRSVTRADAERIAEIYNHYILHTIITFEEEAVTVDEIARRIANTQAAKLPWLVIEEDGVIAGYAYASIWRERAAYRHTAESSIYLADGYIGRGLGYQLYQALLLQLKNGGYHAVIGGISLPNPSSITLHEKFGMSQVAQMHEVGCKFGRWIDVGYWQTLL
ncbi:MAG TPA: arsinothricin resistance N-acetyltransferase ArsN1 family B [Dongiaceae bacterium]|nr:arsinothricin resistance N-acetyltransferase ArsN1 family B [Dongiaceae bacterium]